MYTAKQLDELVKEIAERQTKPVIDASIDQIADEIEARGMKKPSKAAIWLSLHRIGAVSSGRKFIYKHNKESHD